MLLGNMVPPEIFSRTMIMHWVGSVCCSAQTQAATRVCTDVIDPIGLRNVVGEYGPAGNLLAHYDHALGGLGLLQRTDASGDAGLYIFDGIGNIQQVVSTEGVVANSYAYLPFGAPLMKTETVPNPFQFVGQFGVMRSEEHTS